MMETETLQEDVRSKGHEAQLIAVASGKGGVGKTWLSISLAQAIARLDRHVLLFDGDLGLANVDIQLGLNPERDLGEVLAGRRGLEDVALPCAAGGFDVVAGRSGSGSLANLAGDKLEHLATELRRQAAGYDRVILDLGAGIERTVRFLASRANCCLVVTNDEPTSITDAYAFIKLGLRHDPSADLRIVVNMAKSEGDGERTYATLRKACESFLKAQPPLAGVIRQDSKVKDAIRHQTPLLLRHPTCQAAADVEKLAKTLVG